MKRVLFALTLAAVLVPATSTLAVAQEPSRAIHRTIPITNMIQQAFEAGTRDSTGTPGPNYWQNSVDYTIAASLDPATSVVTGRETVVLHNNSPEEMRNIVLRLDQNIFAENAPRDRSVPSITDGMNVTRLAIDGRSVDLTTPAARGEGGRRRETGPPTEPLAFNFNSTSARVQLSDPIAAHGSATLEIEWHFEVPLVPSGRGLRMGRQADTLYQVAQWYPRVAVFDDYGAGPRIPTSATANSTTTSGTST